MVAVVDALDIQQLLSRYCFIVDDADWERLADIITDDVVFDFTQFGLACLNGAAAVIHQFSTMTHPIAHHAVNTLIEERHGEFLLRSKMIIGRPGGRTWYGEYRDIVVRSSEGLRFRSRTGLRPTTVRDTPS